MRILVGYDGSQAAEKSLKMAQNLANAFDAEVYIVTSLDQGPQLEKIDIEKAEGELEYLRTPFNIDDIYCETHVLVSLLTAGEDLVNFATENNMDMLCIGIKKRTKVGKFVFGSTAQYAILEAPCPVVAVK